MDIAKNWGFRIVLLYGGFVALMLALVLVASLQREDLVSSNYYDQEVAYEDHIQSMRRTKDLVEPLIWHMEKNRIRIYFPKANEKIKGLITLYRPANAYEDRTVAIAVNQNFTQFELPPLSRGLWRMKIEWYRGTTAYYQEETLYIE